MNIIIINNTSKALMWWNTFTILRTTMKRIVKMVVYFPLKFSIRMTISSLTVKFPLLMRSYMMVADIVPPPIPPSMIANTFGIPRKSLKNTPDINITIPSTSRMYSLLLIILFLSTEICDNVVSAACYLYLK
jgi:hypothetical protein